MTTKDKTATKANPPIDRAVIVEAVSRLQVWDAVPAQIWEQVAPCGGRLKDKECSGERWGQVGPLTQLGCPGCAASCWLGQPAFHAPGSAAPNETKAAVLGALAYMGTATASAIATEAGLPESKVRASLRNLADKKHPYVVRSAEREPTAIGSAHTYRVTHRTVEWLQWWAEEQERRHGEA